MVTESKPTGGSPVERVVSLRDQVQWLHLYTGTGWHDDAAICGTRAALEELRNAIDDALRDGAGVAEGFVKDGEGYFVFVHALSYEEMEALALPYTKDIAREPEDSDAVWPYKLQARPQAQAAFKVKIDATKHG